MPPGASTGTVWSDRRPSRRRLRRSSTSPALGHVEPRLPRQRLDQRPVPVRPSRHGARCPGRALRRSSGPAARARHSSRGTESRVGRPARELAQGSSTARRSRTLLVVVAEAGVARNSSGTPRVRSTATPARRPRVDAHRTTRPVVDDARLTVSSSSARDEPSPSRPVARLRDATRRAATCEITDGNVFDSLQHGRSPGGVAAATGCAARPSRCVHRLVARELWPSGPRTRRRQGRDLLPHSPPRPARCWRSPSTAAAHRTRARP